MKIVQGFPPNIEKIIRKFKITDNTVFAYGNTIYSPLTTDIPQDLIIHEQTHQLQQESYGVTEWWNMYLEKPTFRLTQEVEAYRDQYRYLKSVLNRHGRIGILNKLAEQLSSELYGNIVNKKEAKELIDV